MRPMVALEEKLYQKRLMRAFFYGFMFALCFLSAVQDYLGGFAGAQGYCDHVMRHWVPWERGIWTYVPLGILFLALAWRLRRI